MPSVPTLSCLIVVADPLRARDVVHELARLQARIRHDVAGNSLQAVRRVAQARPNLVLVDLAIDGANGPALVRHLHRMHPTMDVLAFDTIDAVAPPPGQVNAGWSWDQLATVLERWVAVYRPDGPAGA